jgi:hypothetical protein
MKNSTRIVSCIALTSALATPLFAQEYGRAWRGKTIPYARSVTSTMPSGTITEQVVRGQVHFVPGTVSVASRLDWSTATLSISQALPFNYLGHVMALSNERLLVTGWDAAGAEGRAVVLRLVEGPTSLAVLTEQNVSIGSVDAVSVAFNRHEGRLYVLDYRTSRVLSAAWNGAGPLPAAGAFQFCFDEALVPGLARPGYVTLEGADLGETEVPVIPNQAQQLSVHAHDGVIVHVPEEWPSRAANTTGQWMQYPGEYLVRHPGSTYIAAVDSRFGGYAPITIRKSGPGNGAFNLRNLDTGAILASGQLPSDGATLSLGPFPEFNATPGTWYSIETPGDEVVGSHYFSTVRYGVPTGQAGFELSHGGFVMDHSGPSVGSEYFGVTLGLLERTLIENQPIVGALWIGFRAPNGADPVTVQGGRAQLYPSLELPFVIGGNGYAPADIGHQIPIPNDPGLDGLVVLFQYAFLLPSGQIEVSDVFGMRVLGGASNSSRIAAPGAGAAAGVRGPAGRTAEERAVAPAAATASARQLFGRSLTGLVPADSDVSLYKAWRGGRR